MPPPNPSSPTPTTPTVYFGYGSNLWHHQMRTRCPTSRYIGLARLRPYTWLINDRGYANVVSHSSSPSPCSNPSSQEETYKTTVYGLVYTLLPPDEAHLDINEGVPTAYTKEYLECEFWALDPEDPLHPPLSSTSTFPRKIDPSTPPTSTLKMLVYIDRKRTAPSTPRREYVYRMNRGIEDAVRCGVPEAYVESVMRGYIPADDGDDDDGEKGEMAEFARGQAARFRDESGVLE